MTYKGLTILLAGLVIAGGAYFAWTVLSGGPKADAEDIEVTMYRGPDCDCCVDWADYLEDQGMTVIDEKVADLPTIKQEKGVPGAFQSCHTAVVGDYIVEGHVPSDEIRRMVAQQPDAIGIAVPGMPAGSPGMEVGHTESYEVLLFNQESYSVFAEY